MEIIVHVVNGVIQEVYSSEPATYIVVDDDKDNGRWIGNESPTVAKNEFCF